jgi:hypothetical protein
MDRTQDHDWSKTTMMVLFLSVQPFFQLRKSLICFLANELKEWLVRGASEKSCCLCLSIFLSLYASNANEMTSDAAIRLQPRDGKCKARRPI